MAKNFDFGDLFLQSGAVAPKQDGVRRIPLHSIDMNEFNADVYEIGDVSALEASIEAVGLESPIIVTPNGEGYRILSGHRRYSAFCSLYEKHGAPYESIPAVVAIVNSKEEERLRLVMSNATARELSDFEKLMQYNEVKELFAAMKKKEGIAGRLRELACKFLELSSGQAARYDVILKGLSLEDLQRLRDGEIGLTQAYQLACKKQPTPKAEKKKDSSRYQAMRKMKPEALAQFLWDHVQEIEGMSKAELLEWIRGELDGNKAEN